MTAYILRRLLLMFPTFVGITLITFLIVHLAPGSPLIPQGQFLKKMSKEQYQKVLKLYGFDRPLLERYGRWFLRVITFDFGTSLSDGRPVSKKILERLPITLYLNLVSFAVIFAVAIPSGMKSAVYRGGAFDRWSGVVFFILYSLFTPWVAVMLIIIFGVKLDLLPFHGITSIEFDEMNFFQKAWDLFSHTIMPVITLSYGGFAFLARLTRTSFIEVLNQDYIRTAFAKGLPMNLVVKKHAFRNALIPLITIFASILPAMFSGSVIVESIFSIPGMGSLFFNAIQTRDYPVIMGLSTISAILTLLGLLIADVMYAVVDPRIHYGKSE